MDKKWWNTEVGAEQLTIATLGIIAVVAMFTMGTAAGGILGPLVGGLVGYLAKSIQSSIGR